MIKRSKYTLVISGLSMQIETDQYFMQEEAFLPFINELEKIDVQVNFREVAILPDISNKVIYETNYYRVHPNGAGGYLYSFFDAPKDYAPYAVVSSDYSKGEIQIDYLKKGTRCVSEMRNSFAHLDFESILVRRNRIYFHAACVQTELGGILFSGESGIGKSTQASLWEKYRDVRQINGDRPILSKEEGEWLAWGSPYAGSSNYHVNDNCSIAAIVILKQAKTCGLRRLSKLEAFKSVWSGVTVHSWDKEFVEKASDLVMNLVSDIPIFEFSCTPDEAAVDYLEQRLRKECDL